MNRTAFFFVSLAFGALTAMSPASAQTGQLVGFANKCADMFQAGTDIGTPVVLWECTGNANQQWTFQSQSSSSYRIVGLNGLCLVPGQIGTTGLPEIELGACDSAQALWTIADLSGSFEVVNNESALCLDVFMSETDNGTPLVAFECRDQANQQWRLLTDSSLPAYFVPYVEVLRRNLAPALTTLFAVRNPSDDAVTVRYEYYDANDTLGAPEQTQTAVLGPGAVRTVDVQNISVFDGTVGWVGITAVDGATGQPLASQNLYGDYFRFDPGSNFASGDKLLHADDALCATWHIRFFNGGAFDGGTLFRFFVPGLGNGGTWTATGRVFTEGGVEVQNYVMSSSNRATSLSSFVLNASFGTVEWTFQGGVKGHISAVMDALGAFSVGLNAECRD